MEPIVLGPTRPVFTSNCQWSQGHVFDETLSGACQRFSERSNLVSKLPKACVRDYATASEKVKSRLFLDHLKVGYEKLVSEEGKP